MRKRQNREKKALHEDAMGESSGTRKKEDRRNQRLQGG